MPLKKAKFLDLRWWPGYGWVPERAHRRYDGCRFKTQQAARDFIKRKRHKVTLRFHPDRLDGMTPGELDARLPETLEADYLDKLHEMPPEEYVRLKQNSPWGPDSPEPAPDPV